MSEEKRIIEYYAERDSQQSAYQGFFGYRSLADLLMHQERVRNTLQLLQKYNITSHSIGGMKILDVGCGSILREYILCGEVVSKL
jgi:2-polyprenyl-3-methyl-5-hydroxy-6-metoxy-1,4-benzoquinol methylase